MMHFSGSDPDICGTCSSHISTNDSNLSGVLGITKKSLNRLTGHRLVPIQEAVHEIAGLDLVICSDNLYSFSLGKANALIKNGQQAAHNNKCLASSYRNRPVDQKNLSLETYFYDKFSPRIKSKGEDDQRMRNRILLPVGLNCKPCYPISYEYARGMLILHHPWSITNRLDDVLKSESSTIEAFKEMLGKRSVPYHVLAEYNRVVKYRQQHELETIAKKTSAEENTALHELHEYDEEQLEQWEHCCNISANNGWSASDTFGNDRADIGIDFDWSKGFYHEKRSLCMDGELYIDYIRHKFYKECDPNIIDIPTDKDGSAYALEKLNDEQLVIVLSALETIIKFVNNDPTYKPLRATIQGAGGSGKSFVINTLVALIRQYTQCNDSVLVTAPSGGAAFNVGGCTIHRALKHSVHKDTLAKELNDSNKDALKDKLQRLLMFVIDERSMLSSELLAATERNIRQCAFRGHNESEYWGGIPVVLIFGDDCQLPPVCAKGAIDAHKEKQSCIQNLSRRFTLDSTLLEQEGNRLFTEDMTEKVFFLSSNRRTDGDLRFNAILRRLRLGISTEEDAKYLMKLNFHNFSAQEKSTLEKGKTVWLYTKNDEKNAKNMSKLVQLSNETQNPVARLRCHWESTRIQGKGNASVSRSHFNGRKIVLQTDLCVGAPVAINCINILPEIGLYNGARGTLIDIVYDEGQNPNSKQDYHLPKYVVVDFPHLNLRKGNIPPWDSENPTVRFICSFVLFPVHPIPFHIRQQHVPIRPETVPCSRNPGNPCCLVHFCPIVLAWATTIHKFQGFEAGFRAHDSVNRIIADISTLQWEKLHPGTTYVVVSRARTLGTRTQTEDQIMDSALYFDCPIGPERFTKTKINKDGSTCVSAQNRESWMNYLNEKNKKTRVHMNDRRVNDSMTFVKHHLLNKNISSTTEFEAKILSMIMEPNEEWKKLRQSYIKDS